MTRIETAVAATRFETSSQALPRAFCEAPRRAREQPLKSAETRYQLLSFPLPLPHFKAVFRLDLLISISGLGLLMGRFRET